MKVRRYSQGRTSQEDSDRLTATVKPRAWNGSAIAQVDAVPSVRHDFSHVDLFSHAPQRNPILQRLPDGQSPLTGSIAPVVNPQDSDTIQRWPNSTRGATGLQLGSHRPAQISATTGSIVQRGDENYFTFGSDDPLRSSQPGGSIPDHIPNRTDDSDDSDDDDLGGSFNGALRGSGAIADYVPDDSIPNRKDDLDEDDLGSSSQSAARLGEPDESSDDDDDLFDDDDDDSPKSKLPADKAARYADRALKLEKAGRLIRAAIQYTRAFAFMRTASYAFSAAERFRMGGDFERAAVWYRQTIATDSSSPLAQQARDYLSAQGLGEESKYKTSAIEEQDKYVSVRFGASGLNKPYDSFAKREMRQLKNSGRYKEEDKSNIGLLLLQNNADKMFAAEVERDAATDPAIRQAAQAKVDFWKQKISDMATGLNIDTLISEYRQWSLDWRTPTPEMDKLRDFKVKYLHTTAERDNKKLVHEGVIKQGLPPRSDEAEQGYDTSNLSTNFAGPGYAIFVMSGDGAIYADQHKVSQFHHSSFLGSADSAAAGEIKVESGALKAITNKSGHYKQGALFLAQALNEFESSFQQNLSGVSLAFHNAAGKVNWRGNAAGFKQDVQLMEASGKYASTFGSASLSPQQIQDKVEENKNPLSVASGPNAAPGEENASAPGSIPVSPANPYGTKIPANSYGIQIPANLNNTDDFDGAYNTDDPDGAYNTDDPASPSVAGQVATGSHPAHAVQSPNAGVQIPANFIIGPQGLAISPQLLAAIRQDILTPRSKWADNHEILAVATALGIEIEIHPNRGVLGAGRNRHHIHYNDRDHYAAYVPDRNGSITLNNRPYRLAPVPGNGDCFYNALCKAMTGGIGQARLSVSGLRQLANQHLSDQDIADIAIIITGYFEQNPTTPGLGRAFVALMNTAGTHFIRQS